MPGFEVFGDEERKEVQDVLETGVLFRYGFDQARQEHWKARTFESELAQRLDVKYCHLCSSGTAALHIALAACGIGAGDEVIVPPFTFVATIEAVLYAGAIPVFADIDETLCINAESIQKKISPRTRGVVAVHMCGTMAQIDKIRSLCDAENLMLIEDACQAVGGSFHGKALGSFGEMGCFSFDPVKTITCGEGGCIVTNDQERYLKADAFADHGHDHKGNDRGLEGHPFMGLNYRISELNAAVGLAQLRKLDQMLEIQRRHKKWLKASLASFPAIQFRDLPDPQGDTATFLSFLLPDENIARRLANELNQAGVDGCFYWYDNNWHYYRRWDHIRKLRTLAKLHIDTLAQHPDYQGMRLPQSDLIMGRTISMLIKLSWTESDIQQRAEKLQKISKAVL
jgi:8-amino-3,8-dideoxy-alpha-D-manno-octulosonate transaminase